MMALRKLTPGGHEYLTGSVACADRELTAGEGLADYYFANGYPPGIWFGAGAAELGVSGEATAAQMNALFGEGRHPNADVIEAELIANGATADEAMQQTALGRRFPRYSKLDHLRSAVGDAYKQHNIDQGRPLGAPIDDETRTAIRLKVQTQAYENAHGGTTPSKVQLSKWLASDRTALKTAVSGFEMVFAPPKSYSVAWALADNATREILVEIHRQAVKDTLSYFEKNAAFTRAGSQGEAQVDIVGITAVMFEHWDSRTGDPHLHTHVPISAKVKRAEDGKYTSLDGRTIFAATVTLSEFYNSRLRDLGGDRGAVWVLKPHNGIDAKRPVWELGNVPTELIAGFSLRSQQVEIDRARRIVRFRRTHGREPSPKEILELSRQAQYGSRAAKQPPRTLAEYVSTWRAQAAALIPEHPFLAAVGARIFARSGDSVDEITVGDLAAVTRAVVSDHHAHFSTWNLEAEAHRQTAHLRVRAKDRPAVVARLIEAVLRAPDTIAIRAPALVPEPPQLRRASGESVFVEHNATRYTTTQTLKQEQDLVSWAARYDGLRLPQNAVSVALKGAQLNAGQRRMVEQFSRSGARVQLALAPAGAGKTTAMNVFAQAWRSAGGRVFAFGPSARAAQELGQSVGAKPHTLHEVTAAQKFGVAEFKFNFRRGDVLIVDEAAMAGTHTLFSVAQYAISRGANVRLVGDDRQLGAVEAGGAVRLISHDVGAVRFHEVVRFTDPDQAAASLLIREGNVSGLDYYLERGWVHGGSRESMRAAALAAWRKDLASRVHSLLIVPTNDDVVLLNLQAREQLIAQGHVHNGRQSRLHDGTAASAGDWIVTRDNDRLHTLFGGHDFVKNGDVWAVTAVRSSGALEVSHRDHGASTTLAAHYVATAVELAYATTVNRIQGMNGHRSHTLVPHGMTREQLYPALTRGEDENHVYVETVQHTVDSHQETPLPRTVKEVLAGVVRHSRVDTSATEEIRKAQNAEESLATLMARYQYTAHRGIDNVIDRVVTSRIPDAREEPAYPALVQTLLSGHDLGWSPEALLEHALQQGPLDDANDIAAVLHARVNEQLTAEAPPPRTTTADTVDITRWKDIVSQTIDASILDEPGWESVWRVAAAGMDEGLDADSAIARAARLLPTRPSHDPMTARQFAGDVVALDLQQQRADGAGWHPALPWMARPDHHALRAQFEVDDYVRRLGNAIAARADELRDAVAVVEPGWTARLGPRPSDLVASEQWDDLAGLAAAYRETYRIQNEDASMPLGPKPTTHGVRAQAWHAITDRWGTAQHPEPRGERPSPADRLHAAVDDDTMLAALAENDSARVAVLEEPLWMLVARYERASDEAHREDLDQRVHALVATHAPQALGQPAVPALEATLRSAESRGWNLDQLVASAARERTLDNVDDAAAILQWRVHHRIDGHRPPDSAITRTGLSEERPSTPLPWLDPIDSAVLRDRSDLSEFLENVGAAMIDRVTTLRREHAEHEPAWAAQLGPRPSAAGAAERWDELVGIAAAYRETYRISRTDPAAPLGPQPRANTARARSWTQITESWKPPVNSAETATDAIQQVIDNLHNGLRETVDDRIEDSVVEHFEDDVTVEPEQEALDDDLSSGLSY